MNDVSGLVGTAGTSQKGHIWQEALTRFSPEAALAALVLNLGTRQSFQSTRVVIGAKNVYGGKLEVRLFIILSKRIPVIKTHYVGEDQRAAWERVCDVRISPLPVGTARNKRKKKNFSQERQLGCRAPRRNAARERPEVPYPGRPVSEAEIEAEPLPCSCGQPSAAQHRGEAGR